MSDVVKIHTAGAVAVLLGVDYKTVLNLIKRGHLRALPGHAFVAQRSAPG
ncbi:MAG: hypothetical protein WBN22_14725 [Verrucomicrobiia bacterium]